MLEADDTGHRQREGDGQGARGEDLRHDQHAQSIDAIGEDATEELEEDEGDALGKAEISQGERIAADLPGHPGEGHVFRAVPENIEDEPEPVEAIVPPFQGGER